VKTLLNVVLRPSREEETLAESSCRSRRGDDPNVASRPSHITWGLPFLKRLLDSNIFQALLQRVPQGLVVDRAIVSYCLSKAPALQPPEPRNSRGHFTFTESLLMFILQHPTCDPPELANENFFRLCLSGSGKFFDGLGGGSHLFALVAGGALTQLNTLANRGLGMGVLEVCTLQFPHRCLGSYYECTPLYVAIFFYQLDVF
jgi:hypothetical protein